METLDRVRLRGMSRGPSTYRESDYLPPFRPGSWTEGLRRAWRKSDSRDFILVFAIFMSFMSLWQCWIKVQSMERAAKTIESSSLSSTCQEKFDVVYTWVNGSDPVFQEAVKHFTNASKDRRYRDHDELRYSMRSLHKFAPWVGQVYLVTNGQVPSWLNRDKVKVITHAEIFTDPTHLPTFASPAIESNLCNIRGLSDRFLYFNDDILLGAPVYPEDFISNSGVHRIYLSWELPDCAPQCAESFIGDKYCDVACNVSECEWDLGDCDKRATKTTKMLKIHDENEGSDYGSSSTHPEPLFFDAVKPDSSEIDLDSCSQGCGVAWLGDGICDASCRNEFCAYDSGDCPKDVKGLVNSFLLVDPSLEIIVERPYDRNPAWYSFQIDVTGYLKGTPIVAIVHDRPSYLRSLVYVKKWRSIVGVLSLRALDRQLSNFSSINKANIVTCTLKYDVDDVDSNSTKKPLVRAVSNGTHIMKTAKRRPVPFYLNITLRIAHKSKAFPKPNSSSVDILEDEDGFRDVTDNDVEEYSSSVMRAKSEDDYARLESYSRHLAESPKHHKPDARASNENSDSDEDSDDDEDNEIKLDNFAKSLLFTRNQLNKFFKRKHDLSRKVPAHMPHLIDKKVFARLRSALHDAFSATSSHKVRQDDDVQFMYAYFTFLMAESDLPLPGEVIWTFIDASKDGCLNANEFRTLVTFLLSEDVYYAPKPPNLSSGFEDEDVSELGNLPKIDSAVLLRVHETIWKEAKGSSIIPIFDNCLSLHVLQRATRAYRAVEKAISKMWKRTRPTYEIVDSTSHVSFTMLKDKISDVMLTLDGLRARPSKFVCINDDTSSSQTEKALVATEKALKTFFESWFPDPSPYEADPNHITSNESSAPKINSEDRHETEYHYFQSSRFWVLPSNSVFLIILLIILIMLGSNSRILRRGLRKTHGY